MAEERRRGRPRTVDRVEAVQIAMRSWWEGGAAAVSLNEIIRRTGLSKSSLYREFGGEDGLMAAALQQYRELAIAPMLAVLASPLAPLDALEMVVRGATTDQGLPPGCLFTKLRLTRATLGDATQALVAEIVAERHAAFAHWYRSARERGFGAPEITAERAARYLDAQLTLTLIRMSVGDPVESIREDTLLALSGLIAFRR